MARQERKVVTQSLLDSANETQINVLFTNGNVWTKSVYIGDAVSVAVTGVMGLVAATGSAKMTIQVEQGATLPAIEGSASPSWLSTDAIMVTYSTVNTYTFNTVTLKGLPYVRAKITPVTPNTSAYVNLTLSKQVEG